MSVHAEGIKREIAEMKFLIHDLRVEPFIHEVIHFHVTLNTDLELYEIEQAQALHGEDLATLRELALTSRKAFREYSNAVRNFSPDQTILRAAQKYVQTIHDLCDLILNPLWGRSDRVLVFLPPQSRSAQARNHYRNCIAWIRGVRARIAAFFEEQEGGRDLRQRFDVAAEIEAFTRGVIQGYVAETGRAKIELQVGTLEPAVVFGSVPRFHRMYFNLVMNAVDAMSEKRVGVLKISETIEGNDAVLRVQDDGEGMTPEKVAHLMREAGSLDGELHSLGFVFVRQTVADFGGQLAIDSKFGEGTTITIRIPRQLGASAPSRPPRPIDVAHLPPLPRIEQPPQRSSLEGGVRPYGQIILDDLRKSQAEHPGSVFAIAVAADGRVDAFTHRPYERLWDISHEDLSPMLWRTIVRGRLERDENKEPVLILKPPQDLGEYFDFREVPDGERSTDRFLQMVRDEYVRTARTLIATGLPSTTPTLLADAARFFGDDPQLTGSHPSPLATLAERRQTAEG